MKTIIIQGSARNDGNTAHISNILAQELSAEVVHLADINLGFYDYAHKNRSDDFISTFKHLLSFDLIVFATPVYWYTMSGRTKVFLDRITDFLDLDRPAARRLKGKFLSTVSVGSDEVIPPGFFVPFSSSAAYLDMNYLGDIHTWIENRADQEIMATTKEFAATLKAKFDQY